VIAVEFRRAVVERAKDYLARAGQAGLAARLQDGQVVIDLPDVQGIAQRTRLFVGDEQYGVRLYNELFRVSRWSEAYEKEKSVGYVYTPKEFAVAVHLSFRDTMAERAGITLGPYRKRPGRQGSGEGTVPGPGRFR
jgi:hypothetical protein